LREEQLVVVVQRKSEHSVASQKRLLDAISVMDVKIDVEDSFKLGQKGVDRNDTVVDIAKA